ncbi:MAG: hypothetical protein JWO46_1435 [Nocardioidaceae bacterium]|nr:hypothetical protein [Nocardioidaceae bacterium]
MSSEDAVRRSVDASFTPLVASLGPWGVVDGHWLPDRDGEPVVWIRTRTEIERVALQAQGWLLPQVQVILTRVGVPHSTVWNVRLAFTSVEAEDELTSS